MSGKQGNQPSADDLYITDMFHDDLTSIFDDEKQDTHNVEEERRSMESTNVNMTGYGGMYDGGQVEGQVNDGVCCNSHEQDDEDDADYETDHAVDDPPSHTHDIDDDYARMNIDMEGPPKQGQGIPSENESDRENGKPAQQDGTPTPEVLDEWVSKKQEALNKKLELARENVEKLTKKVSTDETAVNNKQLEYDMNYEAHELGQHDLDQILKAKDKIEAQLGKKKVDLKKAQNKLKSLQQQVLTLQNQPLQVYMKENKPEKRKRKTKVHLPPQMDAYYNLDKGDDSLSEAEGIASAKKQRKNAPIACRRCKVSMLPIISRELR